MYRLSILSDWDMQKHSYGDDKRGDKERDKISQVGVTLGAQKTIQLRAQTAAPIM